MEQYIEKDRKWKKVLMAVQILYVAAGLLLAVRGFIRQNSYESINALATLLLVPALYLVRRLFHWKGGWQLETYIFLFSFLGWTLGGAGEFYGLIPYYDKAVHCLSGVFVSVLALAFYRMLERCPEKKSQNPATGYFFVFFASMAVAGLFELCEFTLAPIMGRDLQHVADTGVTDTMMDMVVCLVGSIVTVLLMVRASRGKHDPFTDAAEAFACQNIGKKSI